MSGYRPNIFLIIVIIFWICLLVYGTVALSNGYITREFSILSAVASALLILAAMPLAVVIHYTSQDDRYRNITRGLLWFIIMIVASDVTIFLIPETIGNPDTVEVGLLMYIVACLAILVPVGLLRGSGDRKGSGKRDGVLAAAGILVALLVGYAVLSGSQAMQTNGESIAWSAAFVLLETLVVLVLIRQSFLDLSEDIKNLFFILAIYFGIQVLGDAVNTYYLRIFLVPVDISYNTEISAAFFGVANLFLTVALWVYSWKTINPFTVKKVNAKLIDTRRMMNDIIRQSPDAICIYNPDGIAVTANEPYYRILGLAPDDVEGKSNIFSDMMAMGIDQGDVAKLKSGETIVVNDLGYSPKGLDLMVKIYPTYSADGSVSGYIFSFEDITGRVRSEEKILASLEEKKVLLKEIHHRVKNNLQVISSLLSLQSTYIADPVALGYFKESQNRVKSMALVHERLYQSESLSRVNFTEYINNLATFLFNSYNMSAGKVRMNLETESVYINIDKAISCGLILNELVTNSLKYAFPGDRQGEITICMSVVDGRCSMIIGDDGIGFPEGVDFRETATLGMQLIVMLTSQLDGTIEMDRHAGARFTISFPV